MSCGEISKTFSGLPRMFLIQFLRGTAESQVARFSRDPAVNSPLRGEAGEGQRGGGRIPGARVALVASLTGHLERFFFSFLKIRPVERFHDLYLPPL